MKNQPKPKPRVPVQAAPVARQGAVRNEKGVGPSLIMFAAMYSSETAPFAADDAE